MKEIPQKIKAGAKNVWQERKVPLTAAAPDGFGFGVVATVEMIRNSLMDPIYNPLSGVTHQTQPALTPQNTPGIIYQPLEHVGDWFEGYFYTYLTHTLLTAISPKIPESVRLAAASVFTNGVITAVEWHDKWDIAGGVFGTALYLGTHQLSKRVARRYYRDQGIEATNF